MAALDGNAIRAGAVLAALVTIPAGVAAIAFDGSTLLVMVALVGLIVGGARAARVQQRGTPLRHGIVTAVGVYLVVQAIGVLRRAVDPDLDVGWARIASNVVLAALCGTMGGVIGGRLGSRGRDQP
jgi:hypothetical protein